jgi:putative pyruvate formate lyase activating enzyme
MNYNYLDELADCALCPRECHANRLKERAGYCKSDASFDIGAICKHMGEEPVISGKKGICNVFFAHCNIQCTYCQNYQISRNKKQIMGKEMTIDEVVSAIIKILDSGVELLGFVSPSHYIPHMKAIIHALHQQDRRPVIVYNSNAYDKVETLRSLEGMVDVYLPDFKYSNKKLAKEFSDAPDYPKTALKAIKEMVRQKGTSLQLNDDGQAVSGVIIRHLVLPGFVKNSQDVLQLIAEEISSFVHVSLMSQYYPSPDVVNHPQIGRTITKKEYDEVVNKMEQLGLYRGWLQEHESNENYRPDFFNDQPFA